VWVPKNVYCCTKNRKKKLRAWDALSDFIRMITSLFVE
jgi:hypothetical protein